MTINAWEINMEFNKKWENALTKISNESTYIERSKNVNSKQDLVRYSFYSINVLSGCEALRKGMYEDARKYFSIASFVAEYCLDLYKNNWPCWNIKPYACVLMSDNSDMIQRFTSLKIDTIFLKNNSKKETPKGFNYAIQGLLKDDTTLIKKGIEHFKLDINKKNSIPFNKAYILCTEAIADRNKKDLLKGITKLESTVIKKQALEGDICEEILSFFSMVFAKVAWIKGMEIEPQSTFIPIELLKINPLPEYTIPYWFLRDFYREQGVDWQYNPVYPEIQDWDNDPENPNRNKGGFFTRFFKS